MQSDDFKDQIGAVAGQTDMAPYVSLQDQRQMSVPIFPDSQHFVARHSLNAEQINTLATLRDALLPKLISGELRVETFFGKERLQKIELKRRHARSWKNRFSAGLRK